MRYWQTFIAGRFSIVITDNLQHLWKKRSEKGGYDRAIKLASKSIVSEIAAVSECVNEKCDFGASSPDMNAERTRLKALSHILVSSHTLQVRRSKKLHWETSNDQILGESLAVHSAGSHVTVNEHCLTSFGWNEVKNKGLLYVVFATGR
jgi:hypothetical protein